MRTYFPPLPVRGERCARHFRDILGRADAVVGEPYVHESESTASGPDWQVPETTDEAIEDSVEVSQRAISELRRISGLTWEQLGQLFEVSRRSVHF